MASFKHDGLSFHYRETGSGRPFVFQHGLGGDTHQIFDLFRPPVGWRMISMDCRGHGETRPMGPEEKIGISSFADDVLALLDHLGVATFVVGGISMGAAIAANLAVRSPQRVSALVLVRPAWREDARPDHLAVLKLAGSLIRGHGAARGLERFMASDAYRKMREVNPDGAQSLVSQFQHPRAEETVAKLERIPVDAPLPPGRRLQDIAVPTLVLANRRDPVHPFDCGEAVARAIPGAEIREVTSKAESVERHGADVQAALGRFLDRLTPTGPAASATGTEMP